MALSGHGTPNAGKSTARFHREGLCEAIGEMEKGRAAA